MSGGVWPVTINGNVYNQPDIEGFGYVITFPKMVKDVGAVGGAVDTIRQTLYGAAASDPATRPNGTARVAGDLYYNTTLKLLRVWDGTAWIDATSAVTVREWYKNSHTAGATAMTGADTSGDVLNYVPGLETVYKNGVRLSPEADYTRTNSTTITLATGVAATDKISIVHANAYQFETFTAELAKKLDLTGGTLTGLLTLSGDPAADLHAVPRRWVQGLPWKDSVRVATTGNLVATYDNTAQTLTGPATSYATTGSITSGSTSVTGVADANFKILVGAGVSGTGIASGTTVAAISGTAVTLSAAATATGTPELTFTNTIAALSVDGVAMAVGNRVLVKNQNATAHNGIYQVTNAGSASVSWAMARAADGNAWDDLVSAVIGVDQGTAFNTSIWICTADPGGTLGSTGLAFAPIATNMTIGLASQSGDLVLGQGNGRGIRFWNGGNTNVYGIQMSAATDGTWGGRLDTTSDYNIYYTMTGGTNRGHVFKGTGGVVAQIDGTGHLYLAPTTASPPIVLNANGQGQKVIGLNADLLDGLTADDFAKSNSPIIDNQIRIIGAAPVIQFEEGDQADPAGRWRLAADGANFTLRRATAAGSFTGETVPLHIGAGDQFTFLKQPLITPGVGTLKTGIIGPTCRASRNIGAESFANNTAYGILGAFQLNEDANTYKALDIGLTTGHAVQVLREGKYLITYGAYFQGTPTSGRLNLRVNNGGTVTEHAMLQHAAQNGVFYATIVLNLAANSHMHYYVNVAGFTIFTGAGHSDVHITYLG